MSRVKSIAGHGQSIWLDYIDRPLLDEGVLARMVEEDALAGVTSNPAIFQKAITSSDDYAVCLMNSRSKRERQGVVRSGCYPRYTRCRRCPG